MPDQPSPPRPRLPYRGGPLHGHPWSTVELQPVWAMEVYAAAGVHVGERYVDAVEFVDGVPTVDLEKISQTQPEPR